MLSKLAKLLLVITSLAPVLLTLWFINFSKKWAWQDGLLFLIITIFLVLLCLLLLRLSKLKLEKIPVQITSISTSDKETVNFILVYLLPLINQSALQIDIKILCFIIAIFFLSIFTTNTYHFNPLLGFLGYHFYEVTIEGAISFILITRKNLTNTRNIQVVVQLSEYMILEV